MMMLKEFETHTLHRTRRDPWDTCAVLDEGPGSKLKRIATTD